MSDNPLRATSLFNFAVTLSVPNHKMTLLPPEDYEAEALQDFIAVLFRDEVTQPDWVVHGGIF